MVTEMTYTRWDDFLIAEHEMIERCMAVLKECLDRMESTIKDPVQMMRALDFLLEFGDRIHNRKEEDFLFPLMQLRGIPKESGPLAVMLQEHQFERELLVRMNREAPGLKEATEADIAEYKRAGYDYLKIRAEHIWKENDVLYPMGRKVFKAGDNEELLAQFHRLNTEYYGEHAQHGFARMLAEVEEAAERKKGLIYNLSYEQLEAILESLPFEVTFVDAEDSVAYFNRLDREKLFPRTRSAIGRKVQNCHPAKSIDTVNAIVQGFKNGTREKAEFWIDFRGDKVLIRYLPVYGADGGYMGVVEITQAIGRIQGLSGEKRLLD